MIVQFLKTHKSSVIVIKFNLSLLHIKSVVPTSMNLGTQGKQNDTMT